MRRTTCSQGARPSVESGTDTTRCRRAHTPGPEPSFARRFWRSRRIPYSIWNSTLVHAIPRRWAKATVPSRSAGSCVATWTTWPRESSVVVSRANVASTSRRVVNATSGGSRYAPFHDPNHRALGQLVHVARRPPQARLDRHAHALGSFAQLAEHAERAVHVRAGLHVDHHERADLGRGVEHTLHVRHTARARSPARAV